MKKLVLGSLLLAAFVSQTTGCIITSDDDDDDFATINADWSFHTVSPNGDLSPPNSCPNGFGTVALHNQLLDASGRPLGAKVIDLFDCVAMRDFSDPLEPGEYETFISVTSGGGGAVYADSLAALVDVTSSDKTFSAQIVDNGGYFKIGWDLRDMTSLAPLNCADVTRQDGIEINTTLAGASSGTTDQFDCTRGFDFTDAVMKGTYVVQVNAFMDASPNDVLVGEVVTLNNKVMLDRNQVTDLGTVMLKVPRQ
jgi:hypothetical protein